jgi:hypothetical protein
MPKDALYCSITNKNSFDQAFVELNIILLISSIKTENVFFSSSFEKSILVNVH